MKTLFAVFFVLVSSALAAEPVCTTTESAIEATRTRTLDASVPGFLKGATITVKLADGRESTVPAEKFKVVPRAQQFVVEHTEHVIRTECSSNTPNKNRVSGLIGHGAQAGLSSSVSGPTTEVESNVGLVGGAQYQRMLNDTLSVGVQGQTNKTGSILIGIDF